MKKILFAASLFAFTLSIHAADFSALVTLTAADILVSPSVDKRVPLPNSAERVLLPVVPKMPLATLDSPNSIYRPATNKEMYINGGVIFEHEGQVFSVKLGYRKGHYETYVKNYKAIPLLIVTNVTDLVNNSELFVPFPMPLDIFGENTSEIYPMTDGKPFKFMWFGSDVYVSLKGETALEDERLTTLGFKELRQKWDENAKRYAVQYKDKKIYVVPQEFYESRYSCPYTFGFVLSEGSPFYHTTGLPLDYVELYRHDFWNEVYEYKPVAYSIPLGIAIEKSEQGQAWNLRDMTKDELSDALDDEAQDTSRTTR